MPKRKKTWSQRHPKEARQCSKNWKTNNPDWWRGRKYVQLLTSALVHGNAKSTVFKDAEISLNGWVNQSPALWNGGLGNLVDGSKLVPIKGWREFDNDDPNRVKAFLAPGNFKLEQNNRQL